MGEVAVAVVNYNTRDRLHACLATVGREGAREVVVVDNGSSDGSIEMVRTRFPWVTLHVNPRNPGYGAAANEAISRTRAPYVLLLNSDTLLPAGALQRLGAYLDRHPHAAVVGPRLLNPDGTLQPSCYPFPSPRHLFLQESALERALHYLPLLRDRDLRRWSHSYPRVVPWVLGAALAIRRAAWEAVGGFDSSYYLYFEEVDLCYRLRAAAWQVHFAPVAAIVHTGGASTGQRRAEMTRQLWQSAAHFYRRHYGGWALQRLRLALAPVLVTRMVRDRVRLHGARDPERRAALTEALRGWQLVLHDLWENWPAQAAAHPDLQGVP